MSRGTFAEYGTEVTDECTFKESSVGDSWRKRCKHFFTVQLVGISYYEIFSVVCYCYIIIIMGWHGIGVIGHVIKSLATVHLPFCLWSQRFCIK